MAITRRQSLSPGRGFYSGICWLRVYLPGVEHQRSTARPPPFLCDECVGLTSCGYGPPRKRRRYNIGKGELPPKHAIFSQPTFQNNIKYPINVLAVHISKHSSRAKILSSCARHRTSSATSPGHRMKLMLRHICEPLKIVNMKIHAPTTKHSKDVGDTCNSSASKKAQVYGPTLLSQAGATGIDVTWRKTLSQSA